jgi:hypothetical protein
MFALCLAGAPLAQAKDTTSKSGSKSGSKAGKTDPAGEGGKGAAADCPEQSKVNKPAENILGCSFHVPAGLKSVTQAQFEAFNGRKWNKFGPGDGGVRCPKFFEVTTDKTIHVSRLYAKNTDKAKPAGMWWTFDKYDVSQKTAYRNKFAVCKSWNDLIYGTTCTLKKGAMVVLGPSQSVHKYLKTDPGTHAKTCANACGNSGAALEEQYPATSDVQVAVPNAAKYLECPKPKGGPYASSWPFESTGDDAGGGGAGGKGSKSKGSKSKGGS